MMKRLNWLFALLPLLAPLTSAAQDASPVDSVLQAEFRAEAARRMALQLKNAREWRDVVNTFFHRLSGVDDAHGRTIYD